MQRIISAFKSLRTEDRGEDTVEYGLVVSLVSLATVTGAFQLGLSIEALWQSLYGAVASLAGGS